MSLAAPDAFCIWRRTSSSLIAVEEKKDRIWPLLASLFSVLVGFIVLVRSWLTYFGPFVPFLVIFGPFSIFFGPVSVSFGPLTIFVYIFSDLLRPCYVFFVLFQSLQIFDGPSRSLSNSQEFFLFIVIIFLFLK